MKFRTLVIISISAIFSIGCSKDVTSNQPTLKSETVTPATKKSAPIDSKSSTFVKADEPLQGNIYIINEQGKRYLEFADNFKTVKGPDLFVLLHRSYPPKRYENQDYVNLGALQKINGTQRYVIANNINLAEFRSVVVWCRKFNATFGYAPLPK